MPAKGDYRLQDDVFIEELFFKERQRLVRYAQVTLRKRDSYVDPIGRGEEIVQETFYLACSEKRDELLASDDPGRWLTAAVKRKIQEAVRADTKWVRNLKLLPDEEAFIPFQEPDGLEEFFSKEDYELLRWVYSNRRVWWCCELGHEWKTAIAQRVSANTGCPYCANRLVLAGFNDLATLEPEIAAQWHLDLNGALTP